MKKAERYVMSAPPELLGVLAVDKDQTPIQVSGDKRADTVMRKATDEPEIMPSPPAFNAVGWSSKQP